jgi:pimeloyl-ACP methyl ester carboxylesterase
MIHGNSSCKEVFARQLESPLADKYRMIAFDLPGHGASQDAVDPARTYSMPGYADVTLEVMRELDVNQAAVFGWSVGGHIGLELLPRFPGLEGLMIAATPPLHPTPESFQGGFKPHPMLAVLSKPELTDEEVDLFVAGAYGEGATKQLRDAVRRTDGRSRAMLFGSIFDGRTADQRQLAETTKVPLAIVNGANDPMTNTDYIGSLHYASLWEKHCFVLRGEGHAPFLTNPQAFNPIFDRFLADVSKLAARRPGSANLRAVV